MKKKHAAPQWDGRAQGSGWGNWIFFRLIEYFGVYPAYALLVAVSFSYALKDAASNRALQNYRAHLGKNTTFFHLWRHYYAFGVSLIDRLAALLCRKLPFTYSKEGESIILEALAQGNGIILLGSHIGNWEMAGSLLADVTDAKVNIVMLDNEREDIEKIFSKATQQRKVAIIAISEEGLDMALPIFSALRRGEIVCMLGDRVLTQKSTECTFLGAPASFPAGPYEIAAASGAPLIPFFVTKHGLKHYHLQAQPALISGKLARATRQHEIDAAIKKFVGLMESVVRKHPCTWLNFYDYWNEETIKQS
ncbi:MAG: hypothetical protein GF398_21215 [Chitinivibrionales bacterium]|nr:hypothetical protein [Chitinivibrionales bacterium]